MHDTLRLADDELAALQTAFHLVRDAVFVVDARLGRVVDANAAACGLLRDERAEVVGAAWSDLLPHVGPITHCEVGSRLFVAVVPSPAQADPVEADASRDALTGLANRHVLRALAESDTGGKSPGRLALMFIDLDDFKRINDGWGHLAGDRVLQIVAQRLTENIRPGDLIVRYGGDEFVVVVEGVSRRRDLERLARRIGRAVGRPMLVEGHEIELSASVGIAQRKTSGPSINALIAEADRAMYRAKFRRHDAQASVSKPKSKIRRSTNLRQLNT